MKKVIRTQLVSGISSRIFCVDDDSLTLQDLVIKYGKDYILREVFEEKEFTTEEIYNEYTKFISGESSELFTWMYVLDNHFGVVIDEHIYLYHCNSKMSHEQNELFSWEYMESKKFLGDTWWFDDAEILDDIKTMSILDFLNKYKGY